MEKNQQQIFNISLALIWLLLTCTSIRLTKAGEQVQIIDSRYLHRQCKYLGKVAYSESLSGGAAGCCGSQKTIPKKARILLRNGGGELGANTISATSVKSNPNIKNEYILQGYGFFCPRK